MSEAKTKEGLEVLARLNVQKGDVVLLRPSDGADNEAEELIAAAVAARGGQVVIYDGGEGPIEIGTLNAEVLRGAGWVHAREDMAGTIEGIVERLNARYGYLPKAEREQVVAECSEILRQSNGRVVDVMTHGNNDPNATIEDLRRKVDTAWRDLGTAIRERDAARKELAELKEIIDQGRLLGVAHADWAKRAVERDLSSFWVEKKPASGYYVMQHASTKPVIGAAKDTDGLYTIDIQVDVPSSKAKELFAAAFNRVKEIPQGAQASTGPSATDEGTCACGHANGFHPRGGSLAMYGPRCQAAEPVELDDGTRGEKVCACIGFTRRDAPKAPCSNCMHTPEMHAAGRPCNYSKVNSQGAVVSCSCPGMHGRPHKPESKLAEEKVAGPWDKGGRKKENGIYVAGVIADNDKWRWTAHPGDGPVKSGFEMTVSAAMSAADGVLRHYGWTLR